MRALRGNEVAMIFQEPMTSLNPVFTHRRADRRIAAPAQGPGPRGGAAPQALRMLELVEIPAAAQRLDEYPHQLSGGMRQRVMIALAMACDPTLLIADEPTTALDVTIQAQILALMRRLQAETGMSILFITHNLGVVAHHADDVVVMYAGPRRRERAGAAAVRARRRIPTRRACSPACRARRARAGPAASRSACSRSAARSSSPLAPPPGCAFEPRCDRAIAACREAHAARCSTDGRAAAGALHPRRRDLAADGAPHDSDAL